MALIFTFILASCGKEQSKIGNQNENTSEVYSQFESPYTVNEELLALAKSTLAKELSILVSNKPEVLEKFNRLVKASRATGYYENEFFWNVEKNNNNASLRDQSLSELLNEQNPETATLIGFLCAELPALTVLQVGDPSTQSVSTDIYVDNDIDENNPEAYISYFQNGSESSRQASQEPTEVVYIVRESESYIPTADLEKDYVTHTQNEMLTIGTDCEDIWIWDPGNGGGDPGTIRECEEECERDCEDGTENIRRFRARHNYESWWKASGEFLFYTIFAEGVTYELADGTLEVTGDALDYVIHRFAGVEDNNTWYYPDFEIIIWDREGDGDRMKHVLYEDDGGNETTVEIPLNFSVTVPVGSTGATVTGSAGATINIDLTNRDDLIGESIADYCQDIDPDGFEYHPSNQVDFYLNER